MFIISAPLLKLYRPISNPIKEVPLPGNFSNQAQDLLHFQEIKAGQNSGGYLIQLGLYLEKDQVWEYTYEKGGHVPIGLLELS